MPDPDTELVPTDPDDGDAEPTAPEAEATAAREEEPASDGAPAPAPGAGEAEGDGPAGYTPRRRAFKPKAPPPPGPRRLAWALAAGVLAAGGAIGGAMLERSRRGAAPAGAEDVGGVASDERGLVERAALETRAGREALAHVLDALESGLDHAPGRYAHELRTRLLEEASTQLYTLTEAPGADPIVSAALGVRLARVFLAQDRASDAYDAAQSALGRARAQEDGAAVAAEAEILLGAAALHLGAAREAEQRASHAVRTAEAPRLRFEAGLLLASAHEALGELPSAVQALDAALAAVAPGDAPSPIAPARRADAVLRIASLRRRLGALDDAVEATRAAEALLQEPESPVGAFLRQMAAEVAAGEAPRRVAPTGEADGPAVEAGRVAAAVQRERASLQRLRGRTADADRDARAALATLDALLEQAPGSPPLCTERLAALREAARIASERGDEAARAKASGEALALSRALIAEAPADPVRLLRHGDLLVEAAGWARSERSFAKARRLLEEALAMHRANGRERDGRAFRLEGARVLRHEGLLARAEGSLERARSGLLASLGAYRSMREAGDADAAVITGLVWTLADLSEVHVASGRFAEAQKSAGEAVELARALVGADGSGEAARAAQVHALARLGFVQASDRDDEGALRTLREAVRLGDGLTPGQESDEPRDVADEARRTLARELARLAADTAAYGDLASAVLAREEVVRLTRAIDARRPPERREWLTASLSQLHYALARLGDERRAAGDLVGADQACDRAVQTALELARLHPGHSSTMHTIEASLKRLEATRRAMRPAPAPPPPAPQPAPPPRAVIRVRR